MPTIVVPDPALVLLIGPAGAGKSTFAARHFRSDEIRSSDALRLAVSGREDDQSASRAAFAILQRDLGTRLRAGLRTVVDATNLSAAQRRPLRLRASMAGVPLVAVVFDLPADVVLARNARRERVVERSVVERHLAAVRALVDRDQLAGEGFSMVVVLRSSAEAEGTVVAPA